MVKNYFGRGNCSSNINISYFIINQYCISLGTVLYQLIKIYYLSIHVDVLINGGLIFEK